MQVLLDFRIAGNEVHVPHEEASVYNFTISATAPPPLLFPPVLSTIP